MKLYTATIRGNKFYFTGDLTAESTKAVEHYCLHLESDKSNADPKELFMHLLNHIKSDLGVSVTPVNIENIFRINF